MNVLSMCTMGIVHEIHMENCPIVLYHYLDIFWPLGVVLLSSGVVRTISCIRLCPSTIRWPE